MQPLVLRAILAVEAVVRVHDRPGLSLFDRDLVLSEIDFAQRALVGALVDDHAERLLRIDRKVFERRTDALGLNALDESRSTLARKIGVFGVVFEIAAAQRRTLDVGTGTEQHGHLFANALVRDRAAHLERDLGIPRAGDRRRRRHAGRGHGVAERSALFLFVLLVFFVVLLAQTVRPVGQHDRRQAVLFERLRGPIIFAADNVRLFFQSHLGDDLGMLHSFPPRPLGHLILWIYYNTRGDVLSIKLKRCARLRIPFLSINFANILHCTLKGSRTRRTAPPRALPQKVFSWSLPCRYFPLFADRSLCLRLSRTSLSLLAICVITSLTHLSRSLPSE